MKRNTLLAAMTLTATVLGGAAFAESHHGHGGKSGPGAAQGGAPGMMEGMDGMMDMMQRMHGNMMGGGVMKMLDADGNGTVTPEEMRTQLQAKLAEYDGDGDGSLSIAEFETLHSAMIREMMVDRFQHLDADGDGAVTAEEMVAPAEMMERMQMMRSNMAQSQGQPGNGQGMGDGTMMNDN